MVQCAGDVIQCCLEGGKIHDPITVMINKKYAKPFCRSRSKPESIPNATSARVVRKAAMLDHHASLGSLFAFAELALRA